MGKIKTSQPLVKVQESLTSYCNMLLCQRAIDCCLRPCCTKQDVTGRKGKVSCKKGGSKLLDRRLPFQQSNTSWEKFMNLYLGSNLRRLCQQMQEAGEQTPGSVMQICERTRS